MLIRYLRYAAIPDFVITMPLLFCRYAIFFCQLLLGYDVYRGHKPFVFMPIALCRCQRDMLRCRYDAAFATITIVALLRAMRARYDIRHAIDFHLLPLRLLLLLLCCHFADAIIFRFSLLFSLFFALTPLIFFITLLIFDYACRHFRYFDYLRQILRFSLFF